MTVVCPALPNLAGRQTVEGIEVIRVRYAPRRVETLAVTGSMYEEAKGIRFLLAFPMLVSMIYATIRELRTGAAIAYGHWWVPGGLVAVIAGWCCRRPSVVHLHGSDVAIAANKFTRQLARWVLRRATVRLAVSKELAHWSVTVSGRECEILPMPIDLERFADLSPPAETGFALGVGRLVEGKGFDVLVEAVSMIDAEARPELTIVGVGPERSRLESQARRLGVKLRLRECSTPRAALLVPTCKRCCCASRRRRVWHCRCRGIGGGRVVVATKVGAMPQIIDDGVSGLLVDPGNADDLYRALLQVEPSWGAQGPSEFWDLVLMRMVNACGLIM